MLITLFDLICIRPQKKPLLVCVCIRYGCFHNLDENRSIAIEICVCAWLFVCRLCVNHNFYACNVYELVLAVPEIIISIHIYEANTIVQLKRYIGISNRIKLSPTNRPTDRPFILNEIFIVYLPTHNWFP